jgi:AcrR family transcriptional regulator
MSRADIMKEKIIQITIECLEQDDGKIDDITIRYIADKAQVGIGLINYHFGTKEKLIEICVQRIIEQVINVFRPNISEQVDEIERLKEVVKQVADFLIENPKISKISILADMASPTIMDNTSRTVLGFMSTLKDSKIDKSQQVLLTYCLTFVLQAMFLRKDISIELLQLDYNKKEDRDRFIDFIIDRLYIS